jgi:putative tryptophan/tyrosine transport system substrate-binding protein
MTITIGRRKFIAALGSIAVEWPLAARTRQSDRMRLIGVLMGFAESDANAQSLVTAFRSALPQLGWTEGNNLGIEVRWGAGDPDRMRTFAKELVDLRPDALLGQTTPVVAALARETRTIPIVFTVVSDPIGSGFAESLAHPGGNITGFTDAESAMGGKWVQLLKEVAPRTVSVALLFNPATAPPLRFYLSSIMTAASSFAIKASIAPVRGKDEIEGVVAVQARNPGGSVIVMPDGFNTTHRDLIIELTARYGVPAIYFNRYFSESGGLIAYGDDYAELFRLAAGYVDRILRGEKPGELPIQLPAKFELFVNLKTAKALGLTISESFLLRADGVIE